MPISRALGVVRVRVRVRVQVCIRTGFLHLTDFPTTTPLTLPIRSLVGRNPHPSNLTIGMIISLSEIPPSVLLEVSTVD